MIEFFQRLWKWLHRINWWAIAAMLSWIAAGAITLFEMLSPDAEPLMVRNLVAWLNTGGIIMMLCALFVMLDSMRRENMRRHYERKVGDGR